MNQTLRRVGNLLIALGVLAWVVFGTVWAWSGDEPHLPPYLAWHLSGVLPGGGLRLWLRFKHDATDS